MKTEKWIEVALAATTTEAQVLKSLLEANDIPAIISQENFSNSFGLVNLQLPEVGVLVSPENEKKATALLSENNLFD